MVYGQNPMVLWPLVYGRNPMVLWPMVCGQNPMVLWPMVYAQNPMVLWPMVYGRKPHGSLASGLWTKTPWFYGLRSMDKKPIVLWRQKRIDSIGVNPFGSRSGTRTRVSTVRGWRANRYTNRPLFELCGSRSGTRTRVSTVRGWRANRYTNRPFGYISGI